MNKIMYDSRLEVYTYSKYDSSESWVTEATSDGWLNIKHSKTGLYLESDANGDVYTSIGNSGSTKQWKFNDRSLINRATSRPLEDHKFKFNFGLHQEVLTLENRSRAG